MQRLADSNFWLALTLSKHVFHTAARDYFLGLQAGDTLLFCRATQQSYLRLLTTKEVLAPYGNPPLTNAAALSQLDAWFATGKVAWRDEPSALEPRWRRFASRKSPAPKMWMDAYLAAFAAAANLQLVTTDKAFKQFAGLDCRVIA